MQDLEETHGKQYGFGADFRCSTKTPMQSCFLHLHVGRYCTKAVRMGLEMGCAETSGADVHIFASLMVAAISWKQQL